MPEKHGLRGRIVRACRTLSPTKGSAERSVGQEVAGLGFRYLIDAVQAVGISVGSIREYLCQARVQIKCVSSCRPVQNALHPVTEAVVDVLPGWSISRFLSFEGYAEARPQT